jgi:Zn-dependent peptidase ImmA (M78 family)/transcriptional regulator with XRE-family HTH domain
MSLLETIDAARLGERLRIARSNANLKQDEVAKDMGFARTTLVAIEQGQRRPRANELRQLAALYRVSINDLLRDEAVHVDLVARFRRTPVSGEHEAASDEAMRILTKLATSAVEIETRMGGRSSVSYPPEKPIRAGPIEQQAEDLALELRHRLGLGLGPLVDIVALAEVEIGIRVFFRSLAGSVSGAFVYDPSIGACILVNGNHAPDRQAMTIVHEIGHFMVNRATADVYFGPGEISREERFVTAFSIAFMMPSAPVRIRFQEFVGQGMTFTIRHALLMAQSFGVSFEAIMRRLEGLKLVPSGTFDSLKERGFSVDDARRKVGLEKRQPLLSAPPRSTLLAVEAYRRGIFSEGQLSEMLALDRVQLREHLDSLGGDELNDEIPISTPS